MLIDEMSSYLTKSQDRIQTLSNYMIAQHQHFKLQMQPQEVSGYDLSLSKSTYQEIFVSTDLFPDISAGLDHVQGIARVFREPSNLDPYTLRLITQIRFVTYLSCDLEPDIIKTTSRKIFVSYDLYPYL